MGAAGLKKFAQAGVDIHTLLCMGEIAEVCPASLEYRKEINTCRQQQRKQSIWLYKVVEIGTASNFLADELLKRRAGENIVALMSVILPILTEDDCDSFLLGLFEARHIGVDKTPGLAQLQAFRDAVLSLSQKLAFRDRTWQYHILLEQLHDGAPPGSCTNIPGITTLVQVMLMLQRMVMEGNSKYVFTYRGWQGAAWVIAYARHVLGLAVCVLRTQHDTVPINGQYQNSRVFIYLFDEESRCELASSGHVPDLVMPTDSIDRTQWAVDLENVSLRTLYLSDNSISAEAASLIIESLALDFTARRAYQLAEGPRPSTQDGPTVTPYSIYCLPQLYRRTKTIVNIMGFHTGVDIEPNAETWNEFFEVVKPRFVEEPEPGVLLKPSRRWFECGLPCIEDRTNQPLGWKGRRLLLLMFRLADAASCLAYSNWGPGFKVLSTSFLENGSPVAGAMSNFDLSTDPSGHTAMRWTIHQDDLNLYLMMQEMTFIVLGTVVSRLKDTTAFERQNSVVARAAAAQYSISLDAVIIHFYPGQIVMLGQRRSEIRPHDNPSGQWFDMEIWNTSTSSHDPRTITVHPVNGFPQMTIKSMATLTRTSIEISRNLVFGDRIFQLKGPTFDHENELNLYVTKSCSHPYYSQASVALGTNEVIRCGLHLKSVYMPDGVNTNMKIYLQAVDQNPYGQWASLHGTDMEPYWYNILQRGMCTECTIACVRDQHHSGSEWNKRGTWFVIAAGMAEETETEAV
ncbi:MAG: hypothetical protein Q9208_001957 [Pyrenodesmia sp. 3 TL-2023]